MRFKLIGKPADEQRKDGTFAFIEQLHNEKLNAHYLARQFHNVPFHIYLNKKIDKLDFTGLKIRVTPVYKDIVEALGGTTVTTAPGEVYTALERGVVDGYGWPVTGIFDLGWEKVTKYRMEPAFYSVEVGVLVNLDVWKGLTDAQRKVLNDAALWLEGLDSENDALIKSERDKQAKAGIQPIEFSAADSKAFLAKANDVGWASVIKRSPENGAKLRRCRGIKVRHSAAPLIGPRLRSGGAKGTPAWARPGMTADRLAYFHDPPLQRLRPPAQRARHRRGADAARHGRHGHRRHHPAQPHAHRLSLGQRSLRIRALRHHAADRAVAACAAASTCGSISCSRLCRRGRRG